MRPEDACGSEGAGWCQGRHSHWLPVSEVLMVTNGASLGKKKAGALSERRPQDSDSLPGQWEGGPGAVLVWPAQLLWVGGGRVQVP